MEVKLKIPREEYSGLSRKLCFISKYTSYRVTLYQGVTVCEIRKQVMCKVMTVILCICFIMTFIMYNVYI